MKEVKNDVIKKFEYNVGCDTYYIYIVETVGGYGCYLQNSCYSIMSLMFGLPKEQNSLEEVIQIVNNNLKEEISIYNRLYED
jgi:hypothetical protein